MSRIALTEIGTNTTKFVIAEVRKGRPQVRYFHKVTTRIGRDLATTGRLSPAGVSATVAAIESFRQRQRSDDHRVAVATYALRKAHHSATAVRRMEKALGCAIEIVSGRREAEFAYVSARSSMELRRQWTVLVDVGGGSTEIVVVRDGSVRNLRSLAMGALLLSERFISNDPIAPAELARMQRFVRKKWQTALHSLGIDDIAPSTVDLVASGGSASTITRMLASDRVRRGALASLLDRTASLTVTARRHLRGLEPERADIIPAGMTIVLTLMECLRKRVLYVNDGGVRAGVLEYLAKNNYR